MYVISCTKLWHKYVEEKKVHLLDLMADKNSKNKFHEDTHTGQQTNYNRVMSGKLKTSSVISLYQIANFRVKGDWTENILFFSLFIN